MEQIETAVGENNRLALSFGFGANDLELGKVLELS
jgi:hypothetical protein